VTIAHSIVLAGMIWILHYDHSPLLYRYQPKANLNAFGASQSPARNHLTRTV
jgi:hypothetical protein